MKSKKDCWDNKRDIGLFISAEELEKLIKLCTNNQNSFLPAELLDLKEHLISVLKGQ
jgi:hypothetical protein